MGLHEYLTDRGLHQKSIHLQEFDEILIFYPFVLLNRGRASEASSLFLYKNFLSIKISYLS